MADSLAPSIHTNLQLAFLTPPIPLLKEEAIGSAIIGISASKGVWWFSGLSPDG
ncbi:hypothetical protein [Algoriphagus sp. Y33]|uniref:hypothetical protein n=1 Tax=Algoriphagus sp. Y33 TaxID=2772483 RepID=UPI00178632E7|nr:hypothetical protein [Algoriphagus sp. Y33]